MVETNVSSFFDICPLILRHTSRANTKKPTNFGLMFKEQLFPKLKSNNEKGNHTLID